MGERVPQRVQNIVIRDYCSNHRFSYLLGAVEYSFDGATAILESLIERIGEVDGLVFYSIFQLPSDDSKRSWVIANALSKGKEFHFALEGISIKCWRDEKSVNQMWLIRKAVDIQSKALLKSLAPYAL